MNPQEERAIWAALAPQLAARGFHVPDTVKMQWTDDVKRDYTLAMDAQPQLSTDPNSSVPLILTTGIDPEVYRAVFAPNKSTDIMGERKIGTWLNDTWLFPIAEQVGEVTSYGDFNENGHAGVNMNWPARQQYQMQTMKEYGEKEIERASLGRISWVSEIDVAAALALNKGMNTINFYGVYGLQNYGILNDPHLSGSLTPAVKAYGGTTWFNNGAPAASANEVYNDIVAVFEQVVTQCNGTVDKEAAMTLAMSPGSSVGLTFTNSFNVNVEDLLKKNFPNMTVKTAPQYGVASTQNQQGMTGGNFMQLIVKNVEGQDTGVCAFAEKMRAFPIIRGTSSFRQKVMSGTWGTVFRSTIGVASMLGI